MLTAAELNFPDGKAVVWANQLTHRRADLPSERVYGPDLFLDVFRLGEEQALRHYLLGATPEVLVDLERELRRRHPRAQIVGTESPPFRPLTDAEAEAQIERLVATRAQVVWVGLGTPKQDWEAARLARRVPAVFCAVGAAFDFVAGHKRQAPGWMQDRGLEWLFRLASEPGRLWRRYLFGNARFVWSVAKTLRSPR
jgi:N-acetylglucosaminyldiphosphoundecaprenol N-acetyl-beta-D-mannosaminyltransferase